MNIQIHVPMTRWSPGSHSNLRAGELSLPVILSHEDAYRLHSTTLRQPEPMLHVFGDINAVWTRHRQLGLAPIGEHHSEDALSIYDVSHLIVRMCMAPLELLEQRVDALHLWVKRDEIAAPPWATVNPSI